MDVRQMIRSNSNTKTLRITSTIPEKKYVPDKEPGGFYSFFGDDSNAFSDETGRRKRGPWCDGPLDLL
jgi:hypothetical protein